MKQNYPVEARKRFGNTAATGDLGHIVKGIVGESHQQAELSLCLLHKNE